MITMNHCIFRTPLQVTSSDHHRVFSPVQNTECQMELCFVTHLEPTRMRWKSDQVCIQHRDRQTDRQTDTLPPHPTPHNAIPHPNDPNRTPLNGVQKTPPLQLLTTPATALFSECPPSPEPPRCFGFTSNTSGLTKCRGGCSARKPSIGTSFLYTGKGIAKTGRQNTHMRQAFEKSPLSEGLRIEQAASSVMRAGKS